MYIVYHQFTFTHFGKTNNTYLNLCVVLKRTTLEGKLCKKTSTILFKFTFRFSQKYNILKADQNGKNLFYWKFSAEHNHITPVSKEKESASVHIKKVLCLYSCLMHTFAPLLKLGRFNILKYSQNTYKIGTSSILLKKANPFLIVVNPRLKDDKP